MEIDSFNLPDFLWKQVLNCCGLPWHQKNGLQKFLQKFYASMHTKSAQIDPNKFKPIKVSDKIRLELVHHLGSERLVETFIIGLGAYLTFLSKQGIAQAKRITEAISNLPISVYESKIVQLLKENDVVVIAGETGCGKSTQVPQYIARNQLGRVVCTQPRRVAAVSVAKRVQAECDALSTIHSKYTGPSHISFHIRFDRTNLWQDKKLSTSSQVVPDVVYATEGILLRQLLDKTTSSCVPYDVICVDEVHERHVSTDCLLAVLKQLLRLHPGSFKVLLMSATADLVTFSQYFDSAPTLEIPGKTYPVELLNMPSPTEALILRAQEIRYNQQHDSQSTTKSKITKTQPETSDSKAVSKQSDTPTISSGDKHSMQLSEAELRRLRRLAIEEDLPIQTLIEEEIQKRKAKLNVNQQKDGNSASISDSPMSAQTTSSTGKVASQNTSLTASSSVTSCIQPWLVTEPIRPEDTNSTSVLKRHRQSALDIDHIMSVFLRIDSMLPAGQKGDVLIFLPGAAEISMVKDVIQNYVQCNGEAKQFSRANDLESPQKRAKHRSAGLESSSALHKKSTTKTTQQKPKRSKNFDEKKTLRHQWRIIPLYAGLAVEEQDKVFQTLPIHVHKCILATDIAETSITIDGVRFVVDTGRRKMVAYDPSTHAVQLQEFWIPQSSAIQRMGRAGRTGPGTCYRLYTPGLYDRLPRYAPPEVQRIPVETVLLQALSLQEQVQQSVKYRLKFSHQTAGPTLKLFDRLTGLPLLSPPPDDTVEMAVKRLVSLQAVYRPIHPQFSGEIKVCPLGETLSKLPLDVQLGKAAIVGSLLGLDDIVLATVASLATESLFVNRGGANSRNSWRDVLYAARELLQNDRDDTNSSGTKRNGFQDISHGHGDMLTALAVFDAWSVLEYTQLLRTYRKKRHVSSKRGHTGLLQLRYEFSSPSRWARVCGVHHVRLLDALRSVKQFQRELQKLSAHVVSNRAWRGSENTSTSPLRTDEESISASNSFNDESSADMELSVREDINSNHENFEIVEAASVRAGRLYEKDCLLLKFAMMCGLYPNVAYSDPSNNRRSMSDALYHTKLRHSTYIHPSSRAHVATLEGYHDEARLPEQNNIAQLLMYDKLLETKRTYLTKVEHFPAFWLLLVCEEVITNSDSSMLLLDRWLLFEFDGSRTAHRTLAVVLELRAGLQLLVNGKGAVDDILRLSQISVCQDCKTEQPQLLQNACSVISNLAALLKDPKEQTLDCSVLKKSVTGLSNIDPHEPVSSASSFLRNALSRFLRSNLRVRMSRLLTVEIQTLIDSTYLHSECESWLRFGGIHERAQITKSQISHNVHVESRNVNVESAQRKQSKIDNKPKNTEDNCSTQTSVERDNSTETNNTSIPFFAVVHTDTHPTENSSSSSAHVVQSNNDYPGDAASRLKQDHKRLCPFCGVWLYVSNAGYISHQKNCRARALRPIRPPEDDE